MKAATNAVENRVKETRKLVTDVKKNKKALNKANKALQKLIATDTKGELVKEAAKIKAAKATKKKAVATTKKEESKQQELVKKKAKVAIKPKKAAPIRNKVVGPLKGKEVKDRGVSRVAEPIRQVNSRGRVIRPNSRYI